MSSTSHDAALARGEQLFEQGAVEEALAVFRAVLAEAPGHGIALNDAGLAYAHLGHSVEAAAHFEQALQAEPPCESAYFNLIDLLVESGHLDLAVDTYVTYYDGIGDEPVKAEYGEALSQLAKAEGDTLAASLAQHEQAAEVEEPTPAPTPQRAQRVLCYAPYNMWTLHGMWEITILQALRLRGAEVSHVLCNGLFAECDLFWKATQPRTALSCTACQATVTNLAWNMNMPFEWLGQYLTPDAYETARRWVAEQSAEALAEATYGDWAIGAWVKSSVHSHFRYDVLDPNDEEVAATYRRYLYSGLLAAFGLERLYDDKRPDVMLLFGGRMSSLRVAFELARARGIRVVTHERGWTNESLRLVENAISYRIAPRKQVWQDWGEVPLTRSELEEVAGYLHDREHGRNTNWKAFTGSKQSAEALREQLGLAPGRPTWVLYTSSEDERIAADDEFYGIFPRQHDWIEATVDFARRHPEIDLLIRVHPNTAGKRARGTNHRQLDEMKALQTALPSNVQMIMPEEPVSAYTLMDLATVGLVFNSTVGLEMACKGKLVVEAARSLQSGLPFVQTVHDRADYEPTLDALLSVLPDFRSPELQRLALRYAYGLFFRNNVPFPLVRMPTPHRGELAYEHVDALRPGAEPNLDRVVRILLDGEPVCVPPTPAECARSAADEDAWFTDPALGEPAGTPAPIRLVPRGV